MTDAEASAQIENQDEVVAAAGEGQPKKMRTKKKVLLITLLVILASLVVVYAAGALFFSSHFYPNTRFNDEDISCQADTAFVDKVEAQVPGYKLTITGDDYIQDITSAQVDLSVDPEKLKADAFEAQNVWLWPIEVFGSHDVSHVIDASFDHDKVVEILTPTVETYNKEATPSADATIAYDERINLVVVKDEVYGNQIDAEAFISKVDECLASLEPTYQLNDGDLHQPTIFCK